MPDPVIITGLSEIASDYDALVCDVWGVLHNGHAAHLPACAALKRFRDERGPVVLLSNAPRPIRDLESQFARFGVPLDCYDTIMTSGMAARDDLEKRALGRRLRMLHLGPERDRGVFEGLNLDCVAATDAEIVLCTGLYDDDNETADDYADLFAGLQARGLTMICANPDLVVQRAGKLVPCAGMLAKAYQAIGGDVVYYGKPYRPVYDVTLAKARTIAGRAIARPLAIGDGMETDLRGANAAGLDALFIADGIHGEDVGDMSPEHLALLFRKAGVAARAAMRALVW